MAGGSQIIINDQGITIKTGGKVIFKQGNINLKVVKNQNSVPHTSSYD